MLVETPPPTAFPLREPPTSGWPALVAAVRTLGRQKFLLAVVLNLLVAVPYYTVQRVVFFTPVMLEPGPVEHAIGFDGRAAVLYLSIFLLIPLAPLVMTTPRQLWVYARDVALIGLVSNAIFVFWPTGVARPESAVPNPLYALIVGADRPLNACPSVHASLTVYSALCCGQLLRGRRLWALAAWTWAVAILYATLLLQQHVLVDLVAGAALAAAVFAAGGGPTPSRSRHGE
jgi:membrane-associated phospholipid phosphatase